MVFSVSLRSLITKSVGQRGEVLTQKAMLGNADVYVVKCKLTSVGCFNRMKRTLSPVLLDIYIHTLYLGRNVSLRQFY